VLRFSPDDDIIGATVTDESSGQVLRIVRPDEVPTGSHRAYFRGAGDPDYNISVSTSRFDHVAHFRDMSHDRYYRYAFIHNQPIDPPIDTNLEAVW
jgi:hypothetical protein